MPRYIVQVTQNYQHIIDLSVEAESDILAEAVAQEIATEQWTEWDAPEITHFKAEIRPEAEADT